MFLVVIQDADLAVAPLTITHSRSNVIDFSKPYQDLGMTILMSKETQPSRILAFLDPFITDLWLVLAATFIVASIALTCLR